MNGQHVFSEGQHLSDQQLNLLADGELSPEQNAEVMTHLAGCPECTSAALAQIMLKSVAARAGRRYELPPDVKARLLAKRSVERPATTGGWGWMGTVAAAAVVLVLVGLGMVQRGAAGRAAETALVTEMTDQHVAMMAVNAPPEVVSSDRHTVKPWFQGKIPFSFNLPEGLPSDVTLDGANLTYVGHRPVAQLLYSIGRHRVSVYVEERETGMGEVRSGDHTGFHVTGFQTDGLSVVAVSDVEPKRLGELMEMIRRAQ